MITRCNSSRAWALLPVKPPKAAKSRLSVVFTISERAGLQQAMLEDVLASLARARSLAGVAVISPDRGIGRIAGAHGARYIAEDPDTGDLNQALAMGVADLQRVGADLVAVIPADVPLLEPADVDRAVRAAERMRAMIVVPDRHGEGTNALVFRADAPPRFEFGPGSYRRHLTEPGRQAAIPMELRSMALDIDTPEDVSILRACAGEGVAPRTRAMVAAAHDRHGNTVCEDV